MGDVAVGIMGIRDPGAASAIQLVATAVSVSLTEAVMVRGTPVPTAVITVTMEAAIMCRTVTLTPTPLGDLTAMIGTPRTNLVLIAASQHQLRPAIRPQLWTHQSLLRSNRHLGNLPRSRFPTLMSHQLLPSKEAQNLPRVEPTRGTVSNPLKALVFSASDCFAPSAKL